MGQTPHISFVTFATEDFFPQQRVLSASARRHGATHSVDWTHDDLVKTGFFRQNLGLFSASRGAGYWLWKPFIILEELKRVPEGGFVFYSDCGLKVGRRAIRRPLSLLIDWMVEHNGGMFPGVYAPEWGPSRKWTKGECFEVMGCTDPAFLDAPQVQAGFSAWQNTEASRDFVAEWLTWCQKAQALSDEITDPSIPNDPMFEDHRHDQSVLTLLMLKRGIRTFGLPHELTRDSKVINNLIDRILVDRMRLAPAP
jgi:hypothetical protein